MRLSSFRTFFSKAAFKGFVVTWYRHYRLVFGIAFLLVIFISAGLWYYSVYVYHWSDAEKRTYTEQYFKATTFKEERFKSLVEHIRTRASLGAATPELTNTQVFAPEPQKQP